MGKPAYFEKPIDSREINWRIPWKFMYIVAVGGRGVLADWRGNSLMLH